VQTKGNNAHIIQLMLGSKVNVRAYVKKLLQYYDTVSWVNREKQFHIVRRELCLQS